MTETQDFNGDIEAIQVVGARRFQWPIRVRGAWRWW
jgi:hypothetical protein